MNEKINEKIKKIGILIINLKKIENNEQLSKCCNILTKCFLDLTNEYSNTFVFSEKVIDTFVEEIKRMKKKIDFNMKFNKNYMLLVQLLINYADEYCNLEYLYSERNELENMNSILHDLKYVCEDEIYIKCIKCNEIYFIKKIDYENKNKCNLDDCENEEREWFCNICLVWMPSKTSFKFHKDNNHHKECKKKQIIYLQENLYNTKWKNKYPKCIALNYYINKNKIISIILYKHSAIFDLKMSMIKSLEKYANTTIENADCYSVQSPKFLNLLDDESEISCRFKNGDICMLIKKEKEQQNKLFYFF